MAPDITETHQTGDLPQAERGAYAKSAELLTVAMRIAIPQEDWGSRGAITYAIDIAEALAFLQVKLAPMPNFSDDFIVAQRATLDAGDKNEKM